MNMNTTVPSTLFTDSPHWQWLIIFYFFIGGLAGGTYFVAALIDFFGHPEDRRLARLGYLVSFPAVVVCGLLLILDLGQPLRFWHMLIESNTGQPMLKLYSPMSVGSWALLIFGFFAFLSFMAALGEARDVWRRRLDLLRPPGVVGTIIAAIGALLGFFVAGYTGVLLAVTNRPIWSDTALLGLNFVVSAASTSASLLILLALWRWRAAGGIDMLERFDSLVLIVELLAIAALVASLGRLFWVWFSVWGLLLLVGVVIIGILVPLALQWRPRALGHGLATPLAALLVLVGGFTLRVVIVLSSNALSTGG
jgi:formate-dependent nitrite reductase membrane component NrfD